MSARPPLARGAADRLLEWGALLMAGFAVAGASALGGFTDASLSLWAAILDLFAQFAAHGALVGLALAAWSAALGRRRWALGFTLAAGLTLAPTIPWLAPWPEASPLAAPPANAPPTDVVRLTVLFSNLYYLNRDVAAMAGLFADPSVDVVAVVEATREVQALLEPFAGGWPHRLGCATVGVCSNILYSRRPLTAASQVVSFATPPSFHALDGFVEVSPGAPPLRLIVAHLARGLPYGGYKLSAQQADALAARVGPAPTRTLLVGDFNAAPWTRPVRRLAGPTGLIPAPGATGTWPADQPPPLRLWLDQALLSPDLRPGAERAIGGNFGSDHASLRITLTLQPEKRDQ